MTGLNAEQARASESSNTPGVLPSQPPRPDLTPADVAVTGPARSLLRTLTRRLPLTVRKDTSVSVDGDADLAQHWLDNTAHVSG